jgi:hypothetical protein
MIELPYGVSGCSIDRRSLSAKRLQLRTGIFPQTPSPRLSVLGITAVLRPLTSVCDPGPGHL